MASEERFAGADPEPILTLAVPTYNRADDLQRFLTVLEPQLKEHPEVDLYISDNASPDSTRELVAKFQAEEMPIRYHRHAENIGADANFVSCFKAARGKYFWLCGDDEVIVPGGLDLILSHLNHTLKGEELDILYLSSYRFRNDYAAERTKDRLNRTHHTFTSAKKLTRVLNINFTFISGVIINRDRLQQLPHEDPGNLLGTNLVHLGWTLPLLRRHRRSRILLTRTIASRTANGGGYSLATVFGKNLSEVTARLLPDRPDLSACIMNFAIRRWFPPTILDIRSSKEATMGIEQTHRILKPLFGNNFRYWVFTYPALELPLPMARIWVRITARLASVVDHARNPSFWRRTS